MRRKRNFFEKAKKMLDKRGRMCYNMPVAKKDGLVAQLVRALACHARGRGFEPHPGRHFFTTNLCGFSSFGRASPCQGEGGGFEPRNPLQKSRIILIRLFLSKSQTWHIITARSVVDIIRPLGCISCSCSLTVCTVALRAAFRL